MRVWSWTQRALAVVLFGLVIWVGSTAPLAAQDTPDAVDVALDRRFTYQGRLGNNGAPVNSDCDLRFRLFDAASNGNQVGSQQGVDGVIVVDGLFVVTLNESNQFGNSAFNGQQRWLAIAVRCPGGDGDFTLLGPRQALNATPYALYATQAGSVPWSGVTGAPTYTAGPGLQLSGDGQFSVAFGGNGSANTVARSNHNHFGQNWTGSNLGAGLSITNTAVVNGLGGYGLRVTTLGRAAVVGQGGPTEAGIGLWGLSSADDGFGVAGNATANQGINYGVYGQSNSTSGRGVSGVAAANSGANYGVFGQSNSVIGRGVHGYASANSGANYGVYGSTNSDEGAGVHGIANAATGITHGVAGTTPSNEGRGVYGAATSTTGGTIGVYGANWSTSGYGVIGANYATSGATYGVYGSTESPLGIGIFGYANAFSGINYGIYGRTNSAQGYAGYFSGRTFVAGVLDATTKNFLIDHPLDPENKVLRHASIESSEQLNLYTGNVTLDGSGAADVPVPDWFTALNRDFRYQLTAIGAPGPNLYIAEELASNRFRIAGGAPGMRVSWQISGVRHDPSAQLYPLVIEEEKPAGERGAYLLPAAYGQPPERGTHYHETRDLLPAEER